MEKMGLLKTNKMGDYEKEQGFASYRTIIQYFVGDIVLCNNIINVDESVLYNIDGGLFEYYNKDGEEITQEEYENDETGETYEQEKDIFQWYLCNVSEYEKEQLQKAGIILSYSDMLECDVLCVDHWGTSWDYVLTSVKLFDEYEDLKKYEEKDGD